MPLVTTKVRTRSKQPVEDGQKDGPFEIEFKPSGRQKIPDDLLDAQFPPESFKDQRGDIFIKLTQCPSNDLDILEV